MTPQATVGGLPPQFAAHIDLLHAFLKGRRVQFGSPDDLPPFAALLQEPGAFQDEMAAMLRTVVYREGMEIRRSELLHLLLVTAGGSDLQSSESLREPVHVMRSFVDSVTEPMQLPAEEQGPTFPQQTAAEEPLPAISSTKEYPILAALPPAPAPLAPEFLITEPTLEEPLIAESLADAGPSFEEQRSESASAFSYDSGLRSEPVSYPDPHLAAEFPDAHQPRLETFVPPEPVPVARPPITRSPLPAPPASRRGGDVDWVPVLLVFCALTIALCVGLYVHHRSTLRSAAAERASLEAARRETPPPQPSFGPGPVAIAPTPAPTPAPDPAAEVPTAPADLSSPVSTPEAPTRSERELDPRREDPYAGSSRRERRRERARERQEERAARTSHASSRLASNTGSDTGVVRVPVTAKTMPTATPAPAPPSAATITTAKTTATPAEAPAGDYDFHATAKGSFSVSSGIMSDHLLSAPLPSYPKLATVTHIEGEVIVQAVVGRDGSVVATRVLRGPRLLRGAAQHAVQNWKYRPYVVNGRPTEVATIATVSFRLEDKASAHP